MIGWKSLLVAATFCLGLPDPSARTWTFRGADLGEGHLRAGQMKTGQRHGRRLVIRNLGWFRAASVQVGTKRLCRRQSEPENDRCADFHCV